MVILVMEPIKIWRARLNDFAIKRISCASLISYYNNTLLKNQILPMHAQECVNQKRAHVILMPKYRNWRTCDPFRHAV